MAATRDAFGAHVTSLQDRLSFFVATDALKETRRANWIYSEARQESVAEHVWHTTLLAMLLADAAPPETNHDHVRDLLTIHDLVEVYAGDTVLWDNVIESDVSAREMAAGERLTAMLPSSQQARFDRLWREYQAQETLEARWARAIDSLHPMVLSWYPGAKGHANKSLTPTLILSRKRPYLEPFPVLWTLARWLVQQAVDQKLIPGDDLMGMTEDAPHGQI
jgi:putative hydrolase of HD superfamily